jgi:hypothetical protein
MKRHALLFLLFGASSLALATAPKDGVPAPRSGADPVALSAGAIDPAQTASASLSDLDPDPIFGPIQPGMNWYTTNSATDSDEFGLRVFPAENNGYWVVGAHVFGGAYSTYIAKILEDGDYDTTWGDLGRALLPVPFPIVDVAKAATGDTFYFVGANTLPGFSDTDFGVYCIDAGGDSAEVCDFFGTNGLTNIPIDINGHHTDQPVRIVSTVLDQLFIVGDSDSNNGTGLNFDISVAAVDADDGSPIQNFGNGGTVHYGIDHIPRGVDLATDIVVDENFTLPTHRIYISGLTQHVSANDYDAFVMALDPGTGALDASFNGSGIHEVYADLGATNKQDQFNRVKVLRDHSVVAVGQSQDDDDNILMLAAKFAANGTLDTSFCGSGHCIEPLLDAYVSPTGIAERKGSGDLVFSLDIDSTGSNTHHTQAAIQYGRNGTALRAFKIFDYPAFDASTGSSSKSVLIDPAGRFLITGMRTWQASSDDYDITLVRTLPDDSIFADGFEGN